MAPRRFDTLAALYVEPYSVLDLAAGLQRARDVRCFRVGLDFKQLRANGQRPAFPGQQLVVAQILDDELPILGSGDTEGYRGMARCTYRNADATTGSSLV